MSKTVIITRPKEYQARVVSVLQGRGYDVISAPLLEYVDREPLNPNSESFDAFVFTSQHALSYLDRAKIDLQTPVFTVGKRTAQVAQDFGFKKIYSAEGHVKKLKQQILEKMPLGSRLLHYCGQHRAENLQDFWPQSEYHVTLNILYQTKYVTSLPDHILTLIHQRTEADILFFSRRTAKSFVNLCQQHGVLLKIKALTAYCLSDNVAEPLKKLVLKHVRVAKYPQQKELITLLRNSDI